jgi:hypothetical protein
METEDLSKTLLDMGYTSDQATLALKHSANKSLDGLITWIDENPNLEKFM